MAQLDIKEFESMPTQIPGGPQIWKEPQKAKQNVSISGSSAQSSAFGTTTLFIAITADSAFRYEVGSNPTADSTSFRVDAGQILSFAVIPGQKIAAITTT